jgi:agmatinase
MKISEKRNTFIGCAASYEDAGIVLFGAPFDGTSSYRAGSRFAPSAIRNESYSIETYSPYSDRDLSDISVFDGGDLELPFGNAKAALKTIEEYAAQVISDKKKPVMLGGEHLVTLGAFSAAQKAYRDICVVHFDAHTDLRDSYLDESLSHATVIRRVWDIIGDNRIFQFGIRSGERDEFLWAQKHTSLSKFGFDGIDDAVNAIRQRPVYLTIDLDVLDPSEMPGTGTPEAGGVRFRELLGAVEKVFTLNVVACDIVELAPPYDMSGASTALAMKLLREMLLSFN